jgi:membrane protein implicated in regulation of membrane protease activity
VSVLFLLCFLVGVLFGVRLLFFGAERRQPREGTTPLRRSEPALVGFVAMFGLVGYLFLQGGAFSAARAAAYAALIALVWAALVTRVAIATARIVPEIDPNDPRFILQGCVAVVTKEIAPGSDGEIRIESQDAVTMLRARNITDGGIRVGDEVCIERVEDGVAHVERWSQVEERL